MSPFFNTDKKLISNFVKNGALGRGGGTKKEGAPYTNALVCP